MSLSKIIQPSGGLYYHYKALRYQSKWTPFVADLNGWLQKYFKDRRRVLILGSSAGYCLLDQTLRLTDSFDCFDHDPLAVTFWNRQHSLKPKNFYQGDICDWLCDQGNENDSLSLQWPNLAHYDLILFNNFLGQLRFDKKVNSPIEQKLKAKLENLGVEWVTYHDLYSIASKRAPFKPLLEAPDEMESIADFERWLKSSLSLSGENDLGYLEIIDHEVPVPRADNLDRSLFVWPIRPPFLVHLIEALAFDGGASRSAPF